MIKIRKANNNDIPAIRQLFQETIREINRKDYTPEQVECWAQKGDGDKVWTERIASQIFLVAEKGEVIVGFCALRPADGYLHSMFVHKNYQGQGIAGLLFSNVLADVKDLKQITADVSITARPFFEKQGFVVLKKQTVNIGVKMNNFLMMKEL